jgi:hypothetical protein
MGITAAILVSFIGWLATTLYNPQLPDAERTAVFSLVNDLRREPLMFRVVYMNQHDFMKPEWLKEKDDDLYWQSVIFPENLLRFADFVGRERIAGGMLEPSRGQVVVRPKGLDQLDFGNGQMRYMATVERVKPENESNPVLNLRAIRLYSAEPTLLPKKVLSHLNDLSLPTKIKTALYDFVNPTRAVSFKSIESAKSDFLLLFPDTPQITEVMVRLNDTTPLYPFEGIGSAYEFVKRSVVLVETLEAWANRYSIDLSLFLIPGPASDSVADKLRELRQ